MAQVLANAIVDIIKPSTPIALGSFKVEVWGVAPYDYVRHYEIQARNDTLAAQEGIRRFTTEMENMPVEGN